MKRFSILFLALILVCCMSVGCSPKKEVVISGSASQSDETVEASAEVETDETADAKETEEKAIGGASAEVAEQDGTTPAEPVEIDGVSVSEAELSDCEASGLYGVPYESSVVYSVNGVTNGSLQLQSSPTNLLCYSCKLTLASSDTAAIEMRVYKDGELLVSGTYDVELNAGENSLIAFLKLNQDVSGSYRVEMWYNDQPAAVVEL